MNPKYLAAGLIVFSFMIGWNVFLIHRDEQLYQAYEHHQAIENLKHLPNSEIK